MSARCFSRLGAALVVLAFAVEARAGAPVASNLTGMYQGSFTCKQTHVDGERDSYKQVNSILHIAQDSTYSNGAFLDVTIDGVPYSARTIDVGGVGSGKGVGAFVFCGGGDNAFTGDTEVEKFTFKVNATKGTGTIKKNGLFNYSETLGSCKGSWKRTSVAVPAIAISCGVPEVP